MKKYLRYLPLIGILFVENDTKNMSWTEESLLMIHCLVDPYVWYHGICGTLLLILIFG